MICEWMGGYVWFSALQKPRQSTNIFYTASFTNKLVHFTCKNNLSLPKVDCIGDTQYSSRFSSLGNPTTWASTTELPSVLLSVNENTSGLRFSFQFWQSFSLDKWFRLVSLFDHLILNLSPADLPSEGHFLSPWVDLALAIQWGLHYRTFEFQIYSKTERFIVPISNGSVFKPLKMATLA